MADFFLLDGTRIPCVDKPFASGAKGDVWLSRDQRMAVKIYKSNAVKDEKSLLTNLQMIVETYNPLRDMLATEKRFWEAQISWPSAIVVKPALGVVMPFTDMPYSLAHLLMPKWREKNLQPSKQGWWKERLEICLCLSRAVRLCHQNGLCHSDLSDNNARVDPQSGKCVMIDIDGLVIEGRIPASVAGTRGYMAPELVTGQKRPSINSDKHALAILIYKTLLDRHPLHGMRRFPGATDSDEEDLIVYGKDPLYIEHPDDNRNRPRGKSLPARSVGPYIDSLFRHAFVEGLTRPEKRPMASDWEAAISHTLDRLVQCTSPNCRTSQFVFDDTLSLNCPACGNRTECKQIGPLLLPYRGTRIPGSYRQEEVSEAQTLIVGRNQKNLYSWHLRPGAREDGKVEPKPVLTFQYHQGQWSLLNRTGRTLEWFTSQQRHTVPDGQAFPLRNEALISVGPLPEFRLFKVRMPSPGLI